VEVVRYEVPSTGSCTMRHEARADAWRRVFDFLDADDDLPDA
jgi:hypothetical protein